jgi:hypothetical protein
LLKNSGLLGNALTFGALDLGRLSKGVLYGNFRIGDHPPTTRASTQIVTLEGLVGTGKGEAETATSSRVLWENSRMRRLQNQIRLVVSYGMGAFFVAEAFKPNFWRPNIESLVPIVHLLVGLFGVIWFIQAAAIQRQFKKQGS